jgi:hypothetical protein
MSKKSRRDFLKGATAVLGVGAAGTVSGALAAGCGVDSPQNAAPTVGTKFALNESKYRQLMSFPEVRKEFVAALDEVADGLLADTSAYLSFMETSDAVGSLSIWDANDALLTELVGPIDGTSKKGRLKRLLTVSELFDGQAQPGQAGFLDNTGRSGVEGLVDSSSSSVSSGGDCATNGSPTNGCCVIHTWGWSSGDGLCAADIQE